MIRSTGTHLGALAAGVAAVVCLAGCGNGVEVRGPAIPSGPVSASPAPPTSRPSNTPDGAASSAKPSTPAKHTTDPTTKSTGSGQGKHGDRGGDNQNTGGRTGGGTTGNPGSGNAIAKCGLGDLSIGVRVPAGSGAAGSQYVLLTFTNTSPEPCTIYGYAGVSFVGYQNGTQLGKPAARDRSKAPATVRLAPGATKDELLQIADAGNFDPKKCQPMTSDGFRVYPPDSYTAAYVPFKIAACQGRVAQLRVYPVGIKP
jgi:hypothetical protein